MKLWIAISACCLLAAHPSHNALAAVSHNAPDRVVRVVPYNPVGMPVRVIAATAENSDDISWLDYSLQNVSAEDINGIHLQVFVSDAAGKLIAVEECFNREQIKPGATLKDRGEISRLVDPQGRSFVSITKVLTSSGVWQVDESALKKAIKSKLALRPETTVVGSYEPNLRITARDRSEIFELIVRDIATDKKKKKRLQSGNRVIVLRDGVDFKLSETQGTTLVSLSPDEIKKTAEDQGRAVYLIYEPIEIEGSRAIARAAIRDIRARRAGLYVPYKFTFVFTCVRKNGRWLIESALGYTQG